MLEDVWILAARRSPVGRRGGRLAHLDEAGLAAPVLASALAAAGLDPRAVNEVLLANATGPGGNVARVAALQAGLPDEVPAITLDRQCVGGLDAVRIGAALVRSGQGEVYLAGGVESCSRETRPRARFVPEGRADPGMGEAAEDVAAVCGIGRAAQDGWAARSHARALAAGGEGLFAPEVVPVRLPGGGVLDRDETPRRVLPAERLSRLRPAFRPGGTVTAGNACRDGDGAAALLLAGARAASRSPVRPLARVAGAAAAAGPPHLPGLAAVDAVRRLVAVCGIGLGSIDLFEINEPFAALALAAVERLDVPPERVNVWGGCLATGHPYAATGAILLVRLAHGLARARARYGVAAAAAAGGVGCAVLLERC